MCDRPNGRDLSTHRRPPGGRRPLPSCVTGRETSGSPAACRRYSAETRVRENRPLLGSNRFLPPVSLWSSTGEPQVAERPWLVRHVGSKPQWNSPVSWRAEVQHNQRRGFDRTTDRYNPLVTSRKATSLHAPGGGSVESWLVSAGRDRSPGSPLNVPPYPASNFVLGEGRAYSRDDATPGWEALEEIVGGLEGGSAVAFASGMAAIAAVFDQLPTGSIVAVPDDCYQGVAGLASAGQRRGRWTVHRIAVADTGGWIEACGVADLIWLESPSNPLLTVADVDVICAAPRKAGAILGVDNTFATPLNQRPLVLGAGVAVQSVTKFIGGHSDLLGGVLTVQDPTLLTQLRQARELAGATPGTLETFLAVRGARTLALRLERAQHNAMILAERLAGHRRVTRTRYPGLTSHPTHAAARRQLNGFGTIISFEVDGDARTADAVCTGVQLIQHATSLGAVESTLERRASVPGQEHLPATLLRLSVGIEDVEDLWADLERGLRNTQRV